MRRRSVVVFLSVFLFCSALFEKFRSIAMNTCFRNDPVRRTKDMIRMNISLVREKSVAFDSNSTPYAGIAFIWNVSQQMVDY